MSSDFSVGRTFGALLIFMACAGSAPAQSSAPQKPEKAFSSTDEELIGLWSGEGEMIEFRSEGTCRYAGELYPYKQAKGRLIIETPGGNVVFTYKLKGGQLFLITNGQQSVYSRVPVHPDTKISIPANRNPADLVGQWCYVKSATGSHSGRCFILNSDGTYRYTSENSQKQEIVGGTSLHKADSGTWYVDKDRLYYQSTTRGNGWYQLERRNHPVNVNDPMIVLDNEPFVTATPRPPWR